MRRDSIHWSEQRFSQLTEFERAMLRQIFGVVLESGKAPSVTMLHKALQTYRLKIVRTLGKLEQKHRLVRNKETGVIVSVYPLALIPTEHRVIMEKEKNLFAHSAVEALGIPHMFNRNVEIVSLCHMCEEAITINVENGDIVSKSHPRIHISNPWQKEFTAAATYSQCMHFFCSEEHIKAWMHENVQLANECQGRLLEQGYPRIKEYWTRYGRMIGTRKIA